MNFNSVINHILPSASMKIGLNSNDSELTNFAIGAPDIAPPDKLLELLRNRATESNYSYTPTMGSSQGRKNIANILSDSEQELSPDNLLLCEGAKYGIYLTLKAVCQRQSKVLVVEPYWLSYPQIIASLDLQMVIYSPESIENGRLQYNFNELINRAISEKVSAVIINNPNNPSGQIITQNIIQNLAVELMNAGIWLIIDEVYKELIYEINNKESFNITGENVIRVGSFSKSLCVPGLRLGYIVSQSSTLEKLSLLNQHIQTCPNSFSLSIAESISKETVIEHSAYCSKIYQLRYKALRKSIANSRLELLQCDSSFYAFMDFSAHFSNASEACKSLLVKHKILSTPGSEYGNSFNTYVRICLTLPENIISEKFNKIVNEGF